MLTTSLVGTKVTAATRVQTVKRNATVRAATQKMGAKGKKKGEKLSLGEWFMKYALKDSKGTGAGYEDDLKNNQYKPKGNLTASVGGSFKGANDV